MRQPSAIARLIALVLLTTLAYKANAAQHYAIQLDAPPALQSLLQDNLEIYRWQNNPQMEADYLAVLLKRAPGDIRSLLETEGYYEPTIEVTQAQNTALPQVDIHVVPGPQVHVSSVSIDVKGGCADQSEASRSQFSQVEKQWSLPKGAPFRHADWEKAKRDALLPYLAWRCPTARLVDSQATVDPTAHTARLSLTIDTGPVFYLGKTEIKGLRRYPASIVARLNPLHEGEVYSQDKLLKFQSSLRGSAYFSSASVFADTTLSPDGTRQTVPVEVDIKEHPARKLSLGAGYSTDSGPRGKISYSDLNLASRALRLDSELLADTKTQTLTGNIALPMTASNFQDSLHGKAEHTDIEGQRTRTYNIGAKRTKIRGHIETATTIEYTTESQDAGTLSATRNRALYAGYSWTRRAVNNLLNPTRGYIYNLQLGGSSRTLFSDQDFVRGYARGVLFIPVGASGQLILRGEAGGVWAASADGIPQDYLFRTGGDQSVRGYAYQSLGVSQGGAVVGGRWLEVASTEYDHWFKPQWGAAIFVDAGDAADTTYNLSPKIGYGMGVRWKSPVGPLGLDIAYGRDTRKFRLHFSASMVF
jgi:translocation and assembly module TamA